MAEYEVLSAAVPLSLAAQVRELARAEDRSISSVVRRSLAAALTPLSDVRVGEGDASAFEKARLKEI